jgi:hypothetical protein
MSTPYQLSLLRRTFAVLAAAAALAAISDAHAQGKVKLTGASGKDECAYSSMSITPDGSVTVTCTTSTTTPPPPPPGQTISVSPTSRTTAPSSTTTLAVQRNNGTAGEYNAFYQLTGAGCAFTQPQPAVVHLVDGGPSSVNFSVAVNGAGTSCEVKVHILTHLSGTPGATLWEGQNLANITVSDTAPPPPAPPTGCPTGYVQPEKMLSASLAGIGNPLLQMQSSGQVVAIKLPSIPGRNGAQVIFGESAGGAYTPQPVTLDISINKCPGLIDTNMSSACNVHATNGNYNSITWLTGPYSTINSTNSNLYGLCWAGDGGDYYINARWTYSQCAFNAQACGFAIQYNEGY